ncbi:MAG: hypothetical protein R2851_12150 [Caldilineaceae bacterium]
MIPVTGKAAGNDILKRKKSLPLLYAQDHSSVARRGRSLAGDVTMAQLP